MRHRVSIILASASPRRKQLLVETGYKFRVVPPDIDETSFLADDISSCEYTERLALAKAKDVAEKYPDCLVIGADTVADLNGQIIGKPTDEKQAEQITVKLFREPHKVVTAVAIIRLSSQTEIVESDTTIVYPKKLTAEQINAHVQSGCWQGKAGAYAIQESGDKFVKKIEGSLSNVMGLPMELLRRLLERVD